MIAAHGATDTTKVHQRRVRQTAFRRLSGDLFGTAAERFRVRLGARVNERVIRSVNATRHIGCEKASKIDPSTAR
jgi:hypothetical protein